MIDTALSMEMAAFAKQRDANQITAKENSDVQRFYCNATVLITGGTGFLGKQLIEKLLRACRLSKMYVLMRPKKEKDIETRFDDLLLDPVFEVLSQERPDFGEHIVPMHGDVSNLGLGISAKDFTTLTNEVDVIFHLAATTRFDENLRTATLINVRGTREMINLAKACKKLRSFVHVSTAYSHATKIAINCEVDEKFYSSPVPPETLISMAESIEESRLNRMTPNFIKNWPNTYTFTKAVAEEAIRSMTDDLPICIVRPGIVSASYREPAPGWVDTSNVYGASGVLTGLIVGIMHTVYSKPNVRMGYIPCDYVNNAVIVAGRETANNQEKGGDDTKIYAAVCFSRKSLLTAKMKEILLEAHNLIPSPAAVYYNYSVSTDKTWMFAVTAFILHTLPAYILDGLSVLIGKKLMFVKLYRKMHNMIAVLSYFMTNEWKFVDCNLEKLYLNLKEDDKIIFNFDIESIDWREYIFCWVLGVRKYIIKDGLINTDYALKKQFWLRILHYIVFAVYFYGIWKFMSLTFSLIGFVISFLSDTIFLVL